MRAEYDAKALTLMRAIKAGVDPKGIMNPGTLLPLSSQEVASRNPTINMHSLNDWIVKPKTLDEPMETDPQLRPIVKGHQKSGEDRPDSSGESWFNWAWKGWGDRRVRTVTGMTKDSPKEVREEEILEAWADHGDEK
jgi:hypothetical protein